MKMATFDKTMSNLAINFWKTKHIRPEFPMAIFDVKISGLVKLSNFAIINAKSRHQWKFLEIQFTEINKRSNWKDFTEAGSKDQATFCCRWPWDKPGNILQALIGWDTTSFDWLILFSNLSTIRYVRFVTFQTIIHLVYEFWWWR